MRGTFVAILLLIAGAVHAQDSSEWTRFLVPFYAHALPGANGSVWRAETWVRYSGVVEAEIVPRPFCRLNVCTDRVAFPAGLAPAPVETIGGFEESGALVHVTRARADEFTFVSRIRDLSRQERSAGVDVPVVREERFSDRAIHLVSVPRAQDFRVMLRLYALPETAAPVVEVRYYALPDPLGTLDDLEVRLLRTDHVALRTFATTGGFAVQPSFAQIAGVDALPELIGEERVWIEIVPVTPGLRVWAFASVTNNTTQKVTLVTPNR